MSVSKVVSIEITDLVTRVCEMSYGKKNPIIYKSVIFDNPEYSIDDGFIADRVNYGHTLMTEMKAAGIKCKDVVFVLTSNKVISREITIPDMKEELIYDLIDNERGDYFPMDTSDHIFTFNVLEKLKEEKQQRVMVFAAPEILIKNYTALAAENDLKIAAIDYVGNSTYQWLIQSKEPMDMYIQVNEKSSLFTILENNTLALQRNMNFGTATLTNALNVNGLYGKNVESNVLMEKLRNEDLIYHSFTAMEEADPQDSNEQKLHIAKEYLTESVRPFISNISRVLEYYNTKNREAEVSKIFIGGIGSKVMGLRELLESEFNGIEIVIVDTLPGANFSKKNPYGKEHNTELIACLGITPMTINFFKRDVKKEMETTLIFCIAAMVIVTIAGVFIVLNGKMKYDEAMTRQSQLQVQLATAQANAIEQLEAEYYASESRIDEVISMDDATFNYNENWNAILAEIEELGLTNMTITSLTSSATDLTMSVLVNSKEEAAKFLMQMKQVRFFSDVAINGIAETEDPDSGIVSVSFSVLCKYRLPGTVQNTEEVTE